MDVSHDRNLHICLLTSQEKHLVARGLSYALAAMEGLEESVTSKLVDKDEMKGLQRLLSVMVQDDAELEEYVTKASWTVWHLVGYWPPKRFVR